MTVPGLPWLSSGQDSEEVENSDVRCSNEVSVLVVISKIGRIHRLEPLKANVKTACVVLRILAPPPQKRPGILQSCQSFCRQTQTQPLLLAHAARHHIIDIYLKHASADLPLSSGSFVTLTESRVATLAVLGWEASKCGLAEWKLFDHCSTVFLTSSRTPASLTVWCPCLSRCSSELPSASDHLFEHY